MRNSSFIKGISIKNFFHIGHERSVNIKRSIVYLYGIKGISILSSFLIVPLTLNYIGQSAYGIWITLSSVIGWIGFFDIGLGNGLRNKFAELTAQKQYGLAQKYVSTAYALLLIISIGLLLVFIPIHQYVNWNAMLNAKSVDANELSILILIVVIFCLVSFVLKLINSILTADQKPAESNMLELIGSILGLLTIFILTKTTSGSLLVVGAIYSGKSVVVLILATIYYFRKKYKRFKPTFRSIDIGLARYLTNLGVKFFIVQISYLIIFQTSNFIVIRLFDPDTVTIYSLAHRYISTSSMVFFILLTPFWSAFTEAYTLNDTEWIMRIIRKLIRVWTLIIAMVIIMVLVAQIFFRLWVGDEIVIPQNLCVLFAINYIIYMWCGIFSQVLNGTGKIKIQLLFAVFDALLFIPLSIFFARNLNLGMQGIVLALITINIINAIWMPIQYRKIIHGSAKGLWNA